MVAKRNDDEIPFGGGAYFPMDTSCWSEIDPIIVKLHGEVLHLLATNFIQEIREMKITEAEYALLRVISFFTPENHISREAMNKLNSFKLKYINAFNAVVYYSNPGLQAIEISKRVSRLIGLLPVIEQATRLVDDAFVTATLFNWADMQGSLPYEMYMKKNDNTSAQISSFTLF
uniref:NR LBD domain-containing protein n=1 Tax=Acrobeloides nanus TaxID=290746 RepID=A0A914CLB5_9BILA